VITNTSLILVSHILYIEACYLEDLEIGVYWSCFCKCFARIALLANAFCERFTKNIFLKENSVVFIKLAYPKTQEYVLK
jgi:hypothetical protein